ncbi:hypothetical protein [Algoriphagus halophytocola]|uniref:DUF4369 domain-containing protein n=1 Tax=Algoriphagus halophytocola TaxID=2991499 RepID=A0ABY6MH93_9BACT|nr:hypothetical protein [Algoriphagus sp. TR-M5]UZD21549.1 hypothetical protein OM944_12850 [Algoriphagus sp. TR-M5]
MPNARQKKDAVFTPELIRILKIFGIFSIAFVVLLSFFDSKRASNSGKDLAFRMSSSSRIFFLNLKAIHYDRAIRADAGMTLFRHADREKSDSRPLLDVLIILNPIKDEAYLYLEPINTSWPIALRVGREGKLEKEFLFENGNKSDFLDYLSQLEPWLDPESKIELKSGEDWNPIWNTAKERNAILETLEDFARLTEN